ncbi:MAG: 23S rRNA (pseudouridine(1915)-N(3))-methyltransferase RlmH [Rikenellaceae bacterium]
MNIDLIVIGKTNIDYISTGIAVYQDRLKNYINFTINILPDVKNSSSLTPELLKEREGEQLVKILEKYDYIVLLDENGKEHSSVEFANWINKKANMGIKKLCFVVGGAFGFSKQVYSISHEKVSISKMTFSHQMIRLLFTEQLYRAFTILNNEHYHHQ